MEIKIKKLREDARVPLRATAGSAGADLYALNDEPVTLEPGGSYTFPTGIAIELPSPDLAAFVFARSGLACKHGISPANCVGVIDSDYRGEIKVCLVNNYNEAFTVEPGERIAQLVVMKVGLPVFTVSEEISDTERGAGGFGSTGSK
ncbi:MAG: dUTP diphosphatase [Clostridia bacterium]|nr:dUTP diphosphatase [Clostridia bacterium]